MFCNFGAGICLRMFVDGDLWPRDVKTKDLMASIAELRISGSGDIKAQVTQSLTARVSGSGDIKVWGSPAKRDTRVSGSGDIRFK